MKVSKWFEDMKDCDLSLLNERINDGERWKKFVDEFWKFEGKDRDIVLEDLKCDEGLLYKKMVEWNKNEIVIEEGMNMIWSEYSIEDYFRDMFMIGDKYGYELFNEDDINRMLYNK